MSIEKKYTLDDLFAKLTEEDLSKESLTERFNLPNTSETWERIGSKDCFAEIGLEGGELEEFLKEWISENDYNNI